MEDTPSLICAFLPDCTLTFVNAAYARFFQKTPRELVGRRFLELIPTEEERTMTQNLLSSLTPDNPIVTSEHPVTSPDGTQRWQRWTDRAVFDKEGTLQYFQATGEDITELHRHQERLILFATAIEAAAEAVFLTDKQGGIIWGNPAFSALTGYTLKECIGRNPREVLKSGHHSDTYYRDLWETILSGKTWIGKVVNRHKDGTIFQVEQTITPVLGAGGEITHFVSVLHDVTEQLRILEALKNSEERFRTLVEGARDAIFTLSADGNLISLNPAAEVITGRAHMDMLGKPFLAMVHPDCHAQATQLFTRAMQGELLPSFEIGAMDAAGNAIPMECVVTPQCRDGCIVGVMGIARDIRDRRALEEQLRQLQKLDSIGRLTAGIAHDYNNVLTVQEGYLSILRDDPDMPERYQEMLRVIEDATTRATRLTRQLLLFSRKQVLNAQPIDLGETVRHLSKMLERILGEDIALKIKTPDRLPAVRADACMMEQVILNLAINARDAMPNGGPLTISLEPVHLDEATTRHNPEARPGPFLRLSVSDTGTGITPDVMGHLFEPFYTTKEPGKGTGLGLSTAHGIVKQHEGWIEVDSRLKEGTTFTIHLPLDLTAKTTCHGIATPSTEDNHGTETILLVEDSSPVLELTRIRLTQRGYTVLSANSGPKALEIWSNHPGPIDLLLTDIVMPGGISGFDLATKLLSEKTTLKVIFTSGYIPDLNDTTREACSKFRFLQKPYSSDVLLRAIRETLQALGPITRTQPRS